MGRTRFIFVLAQFSSLHSLHFRSFTFLYISLSAAQLSIPLPGAFQPFTMIAQLSALLLGASIAIASPIVDRSPSNSGDATQSIGVSSSTDAPSIESAAASTPSASNLVTSSTPGACESPTIVTITVTNVPSTSAASATSTIDISEADANPTASVPVSRAGGVLQPSAAAEANPRDDTATRAFSSVTIKDASGQCLFIDPTSGDFRQNLIPVQVQDCDGIAGEKFDLITAGVHVRFYKFYPTLPKISPD